MSQNPMKNKGRTHSQMLNCQLKFTVTLKYIYQLLIESYKNKCQEVIII